MTDRWIQSLQFAVHAFQKNLPYLLMGIGLLWAIHVVNWILGYRLHRLGIAPRHLFGLPGIICSPFLHGDFNHLFFNSIPLFVLSGLLLLQGLPTFFCVTGVVILFSGTLVWLFGRRALHVGASAVIMGYWGYLIVLAYWAPGVITVITAILSLYYFGSLLLNLLPTEVKTSWEGHVFGFLGGILAIYACPRFFYWLH